MKLVFATNNQHKVDEIQAALVGTPIEIITLEDAGIHIDIPEPFDTLEQNASNKSRVIYGLINHNCFSEDTGLETEILNGEPGVKSARYAGEERSFEMNIEKLLANLRDFDNRSARFRTVISLILDGQEYFFEGICEGAVTTEKRGASGFGYDPVFIPNGSLKTFAQMDLPEKNSFSHRKKAVDQLLAFLRKSEPRAGT